MEKTTAAILILAMLLTLTALCIGCARNDCGEEEYSIITTPRDTYAETKRPSKGENKKILKNYDVDASEGAKVKFYAIHGMSDEGFPISEEDANALAVIFNSADWHYGMFCDCIPNCVIYFGDKEIRYFDSGHVEKAGYGADLDEATNELVIDIIQKAVLGENGEGMRITHRGEDFFVGDIEGVGSVRVNAVPKEYYEAEVRVVVGYDHAKIRQESGSVTSEDGTSIEYELVIDELLYTHFYIFGNRN